MDEQRILDEMERTLAAADPRLAARLGSFGQQRLTGAVRSSQARTIGGVLALALIAAVTVMVFVISPFASHVRNDTTKPAARNSSAPATTGAHQQGTAARSSS
jgi:hypothetical protein